MICSKQKPIEVIVDSKLRLLHEGIKREPVTTTEAWAVCQKCGKMFRATNIKQEINGLILFTCDKCGGNGVLEELLIDNTND